MEFNTPTTLAELYRTLSEIYYYYRVRREGYEDAEMEELVLDKMEYSVPTEEEFKEKAQTLLSAQFEREELEYINSLDATLKGLESKLTALNDSVNTRIREINELYEQSIEKVESRAVKSGLINSSIVADKTAALEKAKNEQIALILEKRDEDVATLIAQTEELQTKIDGADEYFKALREKELDKKILELKDESEKTEREVFKYNNGILEKETRYRNTIKQAEATLKLQFLEISMGEYTKDQLVDMGYYQDVIDCVTSYYDRFSAAEAFQGITDEKKLAVYLDDMYAEVIYAYRSKAGL